MILFDPWPRTVIFCYYVESVIWIFIELITEWFDFITYQQILLVLKQRLFKILLDLLKWLILSFSASVLLFLCGFFLSR